MKPNIILTKKNRSVRGTVHLTGSKSECNRALVIEALSHGKVKVENEGDFSLDLPNFTSDPLWASLTNNAVLTLYLVDAQTGERLGRLAAPSDLSRKGALKIAGSYPEEVQFTVK